MAQKYIPPFKPLYKLYPDKVVTMGAFGMPEIYAEAKMSQDQALWNSYPVIKQAWDELAALTGRKYSPVELYKTEEAETLILGMGTICETASLAVDKMREQGKKVGLVKLRLWRPLPVDDIKNAISGAKNLLVLDRAVSFGAANGPVTTEIQSIMYHEKERPNIYNVIAGLGGRDVTPEDIIKMLETALANKNQGYNIHGVRG
jgi:pyruvate ferredoxin oxidoreductase alpha subunit